MAPSVCCCTWVGCNGKESKQGCLREFLSTLCSHGKERPALGDPDGGRPIAAKVDVEHVAHPDKYPHKDSRSFGQHVGFAWGPCFPVVGGENRPFHPSQVASAQQTTEVSCTTAAAETAGPAAEAAAHADGRPAALNVASPSPCSAQPSNLCPETCCPWVADSLAQKTSCPAHVDGKPLAHAQDLWTPNVEYAMLLHPERLGWDDDWHLYQGEWDQRPSHRWTLGLWSSGVSSCFLQWQDQSQSAMTLAVGQLRRLDCLQKPRQRLRCYHLGFLVDPYQSGVTPHGPLKTLPVQGQS